MKVLELSGTARQRGRAHGESLREAIHEHRERWAAALARETGLTPAEYLPRLQADTDFFPAIDKYTPDLLEEVRGIAEGANVDFAYCYARQLSDEEPWYRRELANGEVSAPGCSALGFDAPQQGYALIGQNMDCPGWYDGLQVLLKLSGPDMPVSVYNFSLAGKISLCGMNSHGLGICCNTLSQLRYSKTGLPEDYVVRGFLAQPDIEAGLRFLNSIPHASGQNYLVAGPRSQALSLEASASSVVSFRPEGSEDRVWHTNHPLANGDLLAGEAAQSDNDGAPAYTGSSVPRFEVMSRCVPSAAPGLEAIREVLSLREGPLSRLPQAGAAGQASVMTIGCVMMELGPEPRLHVAAGPPCSTPFATYAF